MSLVKTAIHRPLTSSNITMIRKTKRNKALVVADKAGKLSLRSGVTEEDALNKLAYYERLEKEEKIMELHDGHWEAMHGKHSRYKCSHCGSVTQVSEIDGQPAYVYCPYCGARMNGRNWTK